MRRLLVPALCVLGFGACSRTAVVQTTPMPQTQPAPPTTPATAEALPPGVTMTVKMNQTVGTATSKVGDRFTASVTTPVIAENGATAVPAGATVSGTVTGLDDSDHPGDEALIRLDFDQLTIDGTSHPFAADIVSANMQVGDRTVEARHGAITGAAAGAVAAAILSGVDLTKILEGGALGAGAGAVIGAIGETNASIPAGNTMTLQTTQTVPLR